jgi:phosphopantothenoylcysteine decarboxylase / phosphopantothenate---cysteine ligase
LGLEPASAVPSTRSSGINLMLENKRVLLLIGGGIAAYKALDLIRRLKERGARVRCILTPAAQKFVTTLSAGSLSGEPVFTDLFDLPNGFDIGHIGLARQTDMLVVAPATADLMAKLANGHADDLASTVLLATDKTVLLAPAMNPRMWEHPATRRNLARLQADGVALVGPNEGEMAERGEFGLGRMAEPLEIVAKIESLLNPDAGALSGRRVIITSGPTIEPIDPVRFIGNRSSGKQGHALARAAAAAGGSVILVSGPVCLQDPRGVKTVKVETAQDMLAAVEAALPADIAIFAAAVADWRLADRHDQKIKKQAGPPHLSLTENPDILAAIAGRAVDRPALVVGFAAETDDVIARAKAKRLRKHCDWIVANDVSLATRIMGGDDNSIHLITPEGVESWPPQSKDGVARRLIGRIAATLGERRP